MLYRCTESQKGNQDRLENKEMFAKREDHRWSDRNGNAHRGCRIQSDPMAYRSLHSIKPGRTVSTRIGVIDKPSNLMYTVRSVSQLVLASEDTSTVI